MPLLQASKLDLLPKTHPSSSSSSCSTRLVVSSLVVDPTSRSLALMLSDSSVLLYASVPVSPPFSTPIPLSIPHVSTSACFLRLLPSRSASDPGHVLFLSSSPHAAGSAVILRAWILLPGAASAFAPVRLDFNRERGSPGAVLGLRHGFAVRMAASVNVLVLHSLAAGQIWVLAARMTGEDSANLVKCAVINCVVPIYAIMVSPGFLLLGEPNGVRTFPLRPLIKGPRVVKAKADSVSVCSMENLPLPAPPSRSTPDCCNGDRASCKSRTAKLKQNSGDFGSFFVIIRRSEVHNLEDGSLVRESLKSVSIHALSHKQFLVLDSFGDIHHLSLRKITMAKARASSFISLEGACYNLFHHSKRVQMLAVLPDVSTRTQFLWISDGEYSVHMMSMSDFEDPTNAAKLDSSKEDTTRLSAIQAIFTSEKIHGMVSLASNALLVLVEGNVFLYSIA